MQYQPQQTAETLGVTLDEVEQIRILGSDYSATSLIGEIDMRRAQLAQAIAQLPILQNHVQHLTNSSRNYGDTVRTLLDENSLSPAVMKLTAERALELAAYADTLAQQTRNQIQILNSVMADVDRVAAAVKALIRDYPQTGEPH
jgi:hypothetical protein